MRILYVGASPHPSERHRRAVPLPRRAPPSTPRTRSLRAGTRAGCSSSQATRARRQRRRRGHSAAASAGRTAC
eukprot:725886-Prymnesium_polylepis.1